MVVFAREPGKIPEALFETLRYERGRGVWLWNRHINRLYNSLTHFGCTSYGHVDVLILAVIAAIHQQAVNQSSMHWRFPLLNPLVPFESVFDAEWSGCVSLPSIIASARIRIEVAVRTGVVSVELSQLPIDLPRSLTVSPLRVSRDDEWLNHKISGPEWLPFLSPAERTVTLLLNERGEVTESGIGNIAVRVQSEWITPAGTDLLPGSLRSLLIERGLMIPRPIPLGTLLGAEDVICFNSVRGIWSVSIQ